MFNIGDAQIPIYFLYVTLFLVGACFGSFANVVIYRWPLGRSVVFPGSACPSCKKPIRWYQNIPILSWVFLRGKCANCKAGISVRYPIVELVMALLFLLAGIQLGPTPTLLEALPFIFALVTASVIDLDHFLLPDKLTLSGIVIGLVGSLLNPDRDFQSAILGVVFGGGFLWAIAYLYYAARNKVGLGGGDIKLLAWVGAVLGWKSIPFVILFSSITGAVFGGVQAARTADGFSKPIPFGPFLAAGALLYLLGFGASLTNWYLDLHGLAS